MIARQEKSHELFFMAAQEEAKKATCLRRKCGAVLAYEGFIVGRGFNSPPGNLESQRRCHVDKETIDKKVTDKTCCVHAERRAISDAHKHGYGVQGATMYFTSVDDDGNRLFSGKPYCTDCSKFALDEGIGLWVLEHADGIIEYDSKLYDDLSFKFKSLAA